MINYIHINNQKLFKIYIQDILFVYNQVFSAHPRYEQINLKLIQNEFLNILNSNGIIVIALHNNSVIGFSTAIHSYKHKDFRRMKLNKGWFHSDTALLEEFRGKKISSTLFLKREELMLKQSYSNVRYSRTRIDAKTINSILKKNNFIIIKTLSIETNNVISKKHIWKKIIS